MAPRKLPTSLKEKGSIKERFSKLLQFKASEGHCKVPANFDFDGFNLGNWVRSKRQAKDSLSPERRQRLDDIEFVWRARG